MIVTSADSEKLLANFNGNPPATALLIQEFEAATSLRLPNDYVEFLSQTNGGEGFVGQAYVILWGVHELAEINRAYQVAEYAPSLLLFGSDGGGEAFAFDLNAKCMPIVSVPFVGMDVEVARPVASNFSAFLQYLVQATNSKQ